MQIFRRLEDFKPASGSIVTIGTFDGVHLGHQKIIQRLRELRDLHGGDVTILTFDPHPRKVLYPEQTDLKLITTTEEKCNLLKQFGVDNVIVYPFTREFSKLQANEYIGNVLVQGLKTKLLVIGYDHRFGSNREGNIDTLRAMSGTTGFRIEEIPAQDIDHMNISSTRIRKAIEEGDMEAANQFLGYTFFITGTVVKGKQLGRTIGYPTANIYVEDSDKILPKIGVYAVYVEVSGQRYQGMLNVGTNPTTDSDQKIKVEVNIFDFDADIYGESIRVEFVTRTRDELKFNGLEELKAALLNDRHTILALLSR